ncbi:MAG: hypothetical protein HYU67_04770 [Flavobacteriia bacterium]|nr:hypothetical protein [Flavobacteriia bacterium]
MMNEIIITKTVVIKDSADKQSFESKLFDTLHNHLIDHFKMITNNIPLDKIPEWIEVYSGILALQNDLSSYATSFIRMELKDKNKFEIKCRNYLSLHTNLSEVKVMIDESTNSIYFVLFFKTNHVFFVKAIGESLLVSSLGKVGDMFQIDMSDPTISITRMEHLLPR